MGGTVKCKYCGGVFSTLLKLRAHINRSTCKIFNNLSFSCDICKFRTKNLREIEDHILSHINKDSQVDALKKRIKELERQLDNQVVNNEKKEEIDELTDKIHFLQKMQELINNYNDYYPNYNNKVKKRYFYDKLKISSFPIVFGNKHNTYDFSVSINSIDKKYETCNVDVKRWKGHAWRGSTWRRNFKKRNLSKLYNQIEDLINYDY